MASKQLNAYVCLAITFAAATISLMVRLLARRLTRVKLWYDDWLLIVAYVFGIAWAGLVIYWLKIGLGLFLIDIDLPTSQVLGQSRLLLWISELLYAFSLAFTQLAILGFYWRMFKLSRIRIPIQIATGCTVVWLIIRTFLTIFHCVPVAKFWNPLLDGQCSIHDSAFFVSTVIAHLFLGVAILALPVIEVAKLQMPLLQRLGVIAMFGFGLLVCMAGVAVIVLSLRYDTTRTEMPWEIAPIVIWATAEVNLAIVSASLPMFRPIYLSLCHRPLGSEISQSRPESPPIPHQLSNLKKLPNGTIFEASSSTSNFVTRQNSVRSTLTSTSTFWNEHGNTTLVTGPSRDNVDIDITRTSSRSGTVGSEPLLASGHVRKNSGRLIGHARKDSGRLIGHVRKDSTKLGLTRKGSGRLTGHSRKESDWGDLGGIEVLMETKVTSETIANV